MERESSSFGFWFRLFLSVGILFLLGSANIRLDGSLESLSNLTRWNEFNFISWVSQALIERASAASLNLERYLSDEDQSEIVVTYLQQIALVEQLEAELVRAGSDPASAASLEELAALQVNLEAEKKRMDAYGRLAESILQNQTERSLTQLGFGWGGQVFPPVLFKVSDLPLNLILSPRDQIETLKSFSLKAGMDSLEKEELENKILDQYDLSALVEPVGGLGAYPTMVMRTTSLNWLTEVVAHEWIHNYLSFFPLGVRYFQDGQLRSMNETLANLAGKEIGRRTMLDHYPEYLSMPQFQGRQSTTVLFEGTGKPFNFRLEMRETRFTVDHLLAIGQIEEAERYMEARRQFFWQNGYQLRKINQAYFAFYGSYNDTPGGGASGSDPVGPAVQAFRKANASLKVFIDEMKKMTSFGELQKELN